MNDQEHFVDPVVEVYMRDVDRTILRENLKLTPEQRLEKLVRFSRFVATLSEAGRLARQKSATSASDER